MKCDLVLAGVGGQGVVSLGLVLARCARAEGFEVQMAEVHGMAQRGGSVQSTLRISDQPIHGALIPSGDADLVIATEPLEALRYAGELRPEGTLVTAIDAHENIPDYPPIEEVLAKLRAFPNAILVEARRLASEAGTAKAANVVMAGAVSALLPIAPDTFRKEIRRIFEAKGDRIVETNLVAFEMGREAAQWVPA
jgi:indolepyruvate ferredoxin oxidoreductase beta subunit